MAIRLLNTAAYLTPVAKVELQEGESMQFSMERKTTDQQSFITDGNADKAGFSLVNDFTLKIQATNETTLFENQVEVGALYTFVITRGSTGGVNGDASNPDELTYVIDEIEQGLGQEVVVAPSGQVFGFNRVGNDAAGNTPMIDDLVGVFTVGTRHSWDFDQPAGTSEVPDTGTANEPLSFGSFVEGTDYEWFSSGTVIPPVNSDTTRYFTKYASTSGLNEKLAANETLVYEFMTSHESSFLPILTGTTGAIQINNGHRTDAKIRLVATGGTLRTYDIAEHYAHGCFNTLELAAGADPTDITVTINGNVVGTQNIGVQLNINDLGNTVRFLKRLDFIGADGNSRLRYEFLESSGLTCTPTVGAGDLTFSSEPKRFEFTLTDGLWIAESSGFPDPVKITIPNQAAKYYSAPVSLPASIKGVWGYGQSLGRNFMNGVTNEQRWHSTVENAYSFSDTNPNEIIKYPSQLEKQAVGYVELLKLTDATTDSYFYENTAQSSTGIAGLSKGQTPYDDMWGAGGQVEDAISVMGATSFSEFNLLFTHGEWDTSNETTLAAYKAGVIQLKDDAKTDARALTSNASLPVRMFYTQVGLADEYREIRQAQYELATEDSELIFAGCRWHLNQYYNDELDTPNPDYVHLSPYGYALLGEMQAEALLQTDASTWQPLRTTQAVCDEQTAPQVVTVSCDVQTAPLRKYEDVADSDLGIYYVTPQGNEQAVTSATLNNDTITVNVGQAVESGSSIRFGSTSRSGSLPLINIKDSTEWTGFDTGFTHSHLMPIHDIAVTFGAVNQPPVANAGANQSVAAGATVNLDGTASTDSDGTIASYAWSQSSGDTVTLTGATTATPSFTAPSTSAQQILTFELTVTDDGGLTSTDSVDVQVAAQVIESTLNAELTGIADGTYLTRVIDTDNNALLFKDNKAWSNGAATFTLPVAVGTNVEYYAYETAENGAGLQIGVTE